jgi:hypothetical protein
MSGARKEMVKIIKSLEKRGREKKIVSPRLYDSIIY